MDKNATSNDPFEEFEFKPINEGLGFHRKSKNTILKSTGDLTTTIKPKVASTSAVNFSLESNSFVEKTSSAFSTTLPRNELRNDKTDRGSRNLNIPSIEDDSIAVAQTAVNEILKNLNHKRQLDFAAESEKQRFALKKSKPVLMASVLDSMLIVAAFLMSMILMLSITKTDLFLNLSHPETSRFIYIATTMLFLAVTLIYMIVNRAFLGFTPGEWAFDQRCGEENEMQSITYIPRIVLRTLINVASGFVVLPIISYLLNKDIAGEIAGISLLRKPTI